MSLSVGRGPLPEADAILESGPALRALMARGIAPREALETGAVKLTGKRELLDRFVEVFRI